MIPLSAKIRNSLFGPLVLNNMLSQGRTTKLMARVKYTKMFFDFILSYERNHGAVATVKWLKASLVALQKELGQDRLVSLQQLGTAAPYSGLRGGLPSIIPTHSRVKIRRGDPREIRFWTGLFNLYRILQIPGELKISTITAPFTGDAVFLEKCKDDAKSVFEDFFGFLPEIKQIRSKHLNPTGFYLSRASSPSNVKSMQGIFTDAFLLSHAYKPLFKIIGLYLQAVSSHIDPFFEINHFDSLLKRIVATIKSYNQFSSNYNEGLIKGTSFRIGSMGLALKPSLAQHGFDMFKGQGLSQFALKIEAAGKIRLFALVDSITQSVLAPLHDTLYSLLRFIPNDGTFDQDASVRRSMEKATKSNCAYSFDLTAATDRLPASLTAVIIQSIVRKPIADLWLGILTDRDFWFNGAVASKYKVSPGPYRYAVGQPMGALSSWAGLAVTHHWIVQKAAFNVYNSRTWNTQYEILGDDLVIFDRLIADEYLKIMTGLGCEINMFKSIVSHNRPVFEFAKRTCWGDKIVSGISIAQIRAGWNVAGRVNNALSFVKSGLITSRSLLSMALSRYTFTNGQSAAYTVMTKSHSDKTESLFALGIVSLFGNLVNSGQASLKELMMLISDPAKGPLINPQAVRLPIKTSLNYIYSILSGQHSKTEDRPGIFLSKPEKRLFSFKENQSGLLNATLNELYQSALTLAQDHVRDLNEFANSLLAPLIIEVDPSVKDSIGPKDQDKIIPPILVLIQKEKLQIAQEIMGLSKDQSLGIGTFASPWLINDVYASTMKYLTITADMDATSQWGLNQPLDYGSTISEAQRQLKNIKMLQYKFSSKEVAKPGKEIIESAPILITLKTANPFVPSVHKVTESRLNDTSRKGRGPAVKQTASADNFMW